MTRKSLRVTAVCMATALCALAGVGAQGAFAATDDADQYVDAPTKIFELPQGDITEPTFGVAYTAGYGTDAPDVAVTTSMGRGYEWQVQQGDQWVTVGSIESYREDQKEFADQTGDPIAFANEDSLVGGMLELPLVEGTYNVRLYSPPTAYDAEFISRTIPYVMQDYETYRHVREKAKGMIAPYCGDDLLVYANMPVQPGLDVNGLYTFQTIYLMEPLSNADDDALYQTAIHECAHYLQDTVSRANDIDMDALNERLLSIYGEVPNKEQLGIEGGIRDGIERNAQCMAYAMGSVYTEHSYINRNECTGDRAAAAQAILEGRLP